MNRPDRKYIPLDVRRAVAKRQGGICLCGCKLPIWLDAKETKSQVEWDHDPALRLRDINAAGTDYMPAQLDPDYIVARCPASHLKKTSGTGATTAGTDTGRIKKERKRGRRDKRPKRKWPSRPMKSPKAKWPRRSMRGNRE